MKIKLKSSCLSFTKNHPLVLFVKDIVECRCVICHKKRPRTTCLYELDDLKSAGLIKCIMYLPEFSKILCKYSPKLECSNFVKLKDYKIEKNRYNIEVFRGNDHYERDLLAHYHCMSTIDYKHPVSDFYNQMINKEVIKRLSDYFENLRSKR